MTRKKQPKDPQFVPYEEETTAIIYTGPRRQQPDLSWLFLCWAWEAGYRDWLDGVRALARALRGLERIGFIEQRRTRTAGGNPQHTFVLTEDAHDALKIIADRAGESGR
jgi:hypothetical protein